MRLIWRQRCLDKGCSVMARNFEQLRGMIETVARALGNELLGEIDLQAASSPDCL